MMAPVSQLDRIENKLDRMDEKLDKVDRIAAVHGVKIRTLEEKSKSQGSKLWQVCFLVLSAFVGGLIARITGDTK